MSPPQEHSSSIPEDTILTRNFFGLLVAQASFGFAWSVFLILPKYMNVHLGEGPEAIGVAVGTAGIASVIAVPFAGRMLDRYGRKPFMSLGALCVGGAALGIAIIDQKGVPLLVFQALQGLGFVFAFNAAGALAADMAPPQKMAQAIGIFGAANLCTNALSPAIGEMVAEHYGWSTTFFMSAAMALVAACLYQLPRETPMRPLPPGAPAQQSMFRWSMLRVYLASFAVAWGFAALFALHAPFAASHGVTQVRSFFLGFTATALIMRLGFGTLIDQLGPLRASAGSQALYAIVPLVFALLGPEHLGVVGALLGVFHGVHYPAITALTISRATPQSRGFALSLLYGGFQGGSALAGFVLGKQAEHAGYESAFVTASIVTFLGAVLLIVPTTAHKMH